MPYEVHEHHGDCPDERPWAVVKIGDGQVMGCHSSRQEAMDQVAALYANEEEDSAERMGFEAVLIPEGERTMDGREFAIGALSWRTPPLPLMMLKQNWGEGHSGSVLVGRIERIWREGSELRAEGSFASTTEGREAAQLCADQMLRWISVDTEFEPSSFEIIEENCGELDDGDCRQTMRVTEGRLMGATMVAFPAFPSAVIVPKGEMIPTASENGRPAVADGSNATTEATTITTTISAPSVTTVGDGTVFVSDAPWNGSSGRFTDEQWRRATAGCEGRSDAPKTDCYLPHHEPGGAVSRAGVHAAAARFNQTQRAGKDRARGHLAGHYRNDLKEEVPDVLTASAVVAHALAFPAEPPAEWFSDPELDEPTPITITSEGRVYGHAALWNSCHIGRQGVCTTPPRSKANYAYFRTGAVRCPTGCEISTGTITIDTGHADLSLDPYAAAAHYDHTGASVADVAVGEDEHGIWFSGALRPSVTDEQLRILRASALSGDWRPIGGQLELVGLLAVNVPGFPVPRSLAASARAYVHEGQQTALIAAAGPTPEHPLLRRVRELEARLARVESITVPLRSDAAARIMASIDNGHGQHSLTSVT